MTHLEQQWESFDEYTSAKVDREVAWIEKEARKALEKGNIDQYIAGLQEVDKPFAIAIKEGNENN